MTKFEKPLKQQQTGTDVGHIVINCPLCEERGLHVMGTKASEQTRQCLNCGYVTAPKFHCDEEMIKKMSPGSVIIDLAGESGGNVEVSDPGNIVISNGVKIICPENLPSSMPKVASDLYAKNVMKLLELITDKNGDISIDLNDEIIDSICVAHKGQPRHMEKG